MYTSVTLTLPSDKSWLFHASHNHNYPANNALGNADLYRISQIKTPNGLTLNLSYNTNAPLNIGYSPNFRYYFPVLSASYSGPNIATTTWAYGYNGYQDSPATTSVAGPGITKNYDFDFGSYSNWNTGLLTNETIDSTKTGTNIPVKSISNTWSARKLTANGKTIQIPELVKQVITQGQAYTATYSNYDNYGYPADITYSSPQGTIAKKLTYYENPALWVFGPLTSTSYNGTKPINSVVNTYNSQGQLLSTSQNGVKTSYTYNSLGNMETSINPLGGVWKFTNYIYGLPETVTNPLGNITTYKINPNGW
jgi:YD repeat-containing protein